LSHTNDEANNHTGGGFGEHKNFAFLDLKVAVQTDQHDKHEEERVQRGVLMFVW
jgi:hypothetical protein